MTLVAAAPAGEAFSSVESVCMIMSCPCMHHLCREYGSHAKSVHVDGHQMAAWGDEPTHQDMALKGGQ
jgi:hypothetical protein